VHQRCNLHAPQTGLNEAIDALREEVRDSIVRILQALASTGPQFVPLRDRVTRAAETTREASTEVEPAPDARRPGPLSWTEVIKRRAGRKRSGKTTRPTLVEM